MATQDDVRRIALSLPGSIEDPNEFKFLVDGKAFVWRWLERVDPKKARIPSANVVAVRVAGKSDKDLLIDMNPAAFFTEPHYDGYPAILVRLAGVDLDLLGVVIADAWRLRAPKRLWDTASPAPPTRRRPA